MTGFTVEHTGTGVLLSYEVPRQETLVQLGVNMLSGQKIEGFLPMTVVHFEEHTYLKYPIAECVPAREALAQPLNRAQVLHIYQSLADTIARCEGYYLDPGMLLLDWDQLYFSELTHEPELVCLPLASRCEKAPNLTELLYHINLKDAEDVTELKQLEQQLRPLMENFSAGACRRLIEKAILGTDPATVSIPDSWIDTDPAAGALSPGESVQRDGAEPAPAGQDVPAGPGAPLPSLPGENAPPAAPPLQGGSPLPPVPNNARVSMPKEEKPGILASILVGREQRAAKEAEKRAAKEAAQMAEGQAKVEKKAAKEAEKAAKKAAKEAEKAAKKAAKEARKAEKESERAAKKQDTSAGFGMPKPPVPPYLRPNDPQPGRPEVVPVEIISPPSAPAPSPRPVPAKPEAPMPQKIVPPPPPAPKPSAGTWREPDVPLTITNPEAVPMRIRVQEDEDATQLCGAGSTLQADEDATQLCGAGSTLQADEDATQLCGAGGTLPADEDATQLCDAGITLPEDEDATQLCGAGGTLPADGAGPAGGARPAPVQAYLLRVTTGERIALQKSCFVLGRSGRPKMREDGFVEPPADYCFESADKRISRRHAVVVFQDPCFYALDISARHETTLNGELLAHAESTLLDSAPVCFEQARRLLPGDVLCLRGEEFRFCEDGAQAGL